MTDGVAARAGAVEGDDCRRLNSVKLVRQDGVAERAEAPVVPVLLDGAHVFGVLGVDLVILLVRLSFIKLAAFQLVHQPFDAAVLGVRRRAAEGRGLVADDQVVVADDERHFRADLVHALGALEERMLRLVGLIKLRDDPRALAGEFGRRISVALPDALDSVCDRRKGVHCRLLPG